MSAAKPGSGALDASAPPHQDSIQVARVPDEMAGARLDVVSARLFNDWSRARLQGWIQDGRLRVNGDKAARARMPVVAGDLLELNPVAEPDFRVEAQEIDFEVIYQDADIAIINKPVGLTAHPGAGQPDQTLQNGLLARFPQTAKVPRAGIVHRLDKNTSGLLIVALSVAAHAPLVAMLARRSIRREYDAVINGTPVSGATIDLPIGRSPRERLKMAVVDGGRDAVTHYRIQERFKHHTHLRVQLETGRTHQIRVHFSHLRMPLVGDVLYGGGGARGVGMSEASRDVLRGFRRQALHSRSLQFSHPVTDEPMRFDVDMPQDLQDVITALRAEG